MKRAGQGTAAVAGRQQWRACRRSGFWHQAAVLLALLLAVAPLSAREATDRWVFETQEQRQLFYDLLGEFACPTCAGSSLAESPAPVAEDMRKVIYAQVRTGKSPDEIRHWMAQRYGAAISTRPQASGSSLALWLAPFALMLAALFAFYRTARSR